jgi:hypothetical protein
LLFVEKVIYLCTAILAFYLVVHRLAYLSSEWFLPMDRTENTFRKPGTQRRKPRTPIVKPRTPFVKSRTPLVEPRTTSASKKKNFAMELLGNDVVKGIFLFYGTTQSMIQTNPVSSYVL